MEIEGPYAKASYIPKLQETGIMALTDLDGTMTTGAMEPLEQELSDRANVRSFLEAKGVVAGAVTARTCALTLSSDAYEASPSLKKAEYPPRWGKNPNTGDREHVKLESVPYFDSCLNFDLTAGFGGPIIVKNGAGYKVDEEYYNLLQFDYINKDPLSLVGRERWRHVVQEFLYDHLGQFKGNMSKLERLSNYHGGVTDSAPLNFRYQFDFFGSKGLKEMIDMKLIIEEARTNGHSVALRISTVDESKPHPDDPEKSRYTLYLIPWGGRKEKMIHRVFSQSVKAANMQAKDVQLFYAGDTLTDLRAGLYAGGEAKMTFLLASGSRLAPYIIEKRKQFGAEDLSFLWARDPIGPRKLESRLVATNEEGVYRFVHKIRESANTIVIGDVRYPGTTAPGSVHAFLEEFCKR